jgi:O-acetylhomoserine/O-acetylserine sulfhydrylase-like pyridoxal-dependent enzyme
MDKPDHFETLSIHAGQPADPATGAVNTPVIIDYLTRKLG